MYDIDQLMFYIKGSRIHQVDEFFLVHLLDNSTNLVDYILVSGAFIYANVFGQYDRIAHQQGSESSLK